MIPIIITLSIIAEYCYVECHSCLVSQIKLYSQCRYAECHYAACCGAFMGITFQDIIPKTKKQYKNYYFNSKWPEESVYQSACVFVCVGGGEGMCVCLCVSVCVRVCVLA